MCLLLCRTFGCHKTYPSLQWKALVAVDILTNMDVVEPPDLLHFSLQHQPLPAGNPCYALSMSVIVFGARISFHPAGCS